ncbi:MAG: hypothetical protein ACD_54C01331G0005 [uncultured bacterium]|uniref:I78 family peptidase inhibitor n=1 Tax=Cypionkella sp. TaxID=2811411 RepID=UPI000285D752|nr:I78 family peptidase inhibitor [Cypionkella sp.]EKD59459.1 MAG: hypothetical protein ACD_54C01331G0005 [uncultured bacterium]KAF0176002.1 MAG: hypothetical protein FD162_11 [Paracoccaceae bacterium]MDO8328828.1 I78 family peptidase inhibitor [Cypionkella sp.]
MTLPLNFAPLALLLAACVAPAPEPLPDPMPPITACGAGELQGLIGRNAAVLQTMRFAGPLRVIRPGMAVTMDYSPDRLNIEVDAREIITSVSCG